MGEPGSAQDHMHLRIQLKQGAVSSPSVSHPSVLGNPCTTQDRVYYFSPLFHTVTPHYNSCRSACKNQYWESPMHLRKPLILLLGGIITHRGKIQSIYVLIIAVCHILATFCVFIFCLLSPQGVFLINLMAMLQF